MSILFTSVPQKILKQSILGSSTTFSINNIKGWDGEDLEASDFGTVGYGAFMSADKTRLEFFEWDASTIAASVINFNKRGLQFDGDLTTEVDANKLDWTANETYVMLGADTSQHFQWLKEYIDGIAISGSPDMSTTNKGLAEEATQAEVDAKTAAGGTLARLAVNPSTLRATKYNDYVADAVGTDSYAITVDPVITAYAAGQEFTFKAGTANTGACTLNVCGLGAKDIKKDVSVDLTTGDILQYQIVKVIYDGTNMQLVSIKSNLADSSSITVFTASGTYTKNSKAKILKVIAFGAGGNGTTGGVGSTRSAGGGGGGARIEKDLIASQVSSTVAVNIAPGGAGSGGAPTSFGSYIKAYNGGNGGGSNSNSGTGGAGGGSAGNGQNGSGELDVLGGLPASVAGAAGISGQGAGAGSGNGRNAECGGGSGGGYDNGDGGSSLYGGGGGGGAENGSTTGGAGGVSGSYVAGGGGTGGAGTTGGAGGAGQSRSGTGIAGDGGGGGGGIATGTGGAGGAGGIPAGGGGGGGGASSSGAGGAGGAGARGEVIVIEYF